MVDAAPSTMPTQKDVANGTGGGFLTQMFTAAVNWLDKEFASPKLTPEQQLAAGDRAVQMSRDLAKSDNPIVGLVTRNSGLLGQGVDGKPGAVSAISQHMADLDNAGAPPPSTAPKP